MTDNQRYTIVSLYTAIAALGTILNGVSLYCQWKTGRRRPREFDNSARLLLSLSLCDSFNCMFVLPVFCAAYQYLKLRSNCTALKTQAFFNNLNGLYSSCLIIIITYNRYLKIAKFATYYHIMSRKRNILINLAAFLTCVAILLVAIVNVKLMLLVVVIFVIFTIISMPILYTLLYKMMRANQRVAPACQRRNRNTKVLKNLLLLNTSYLVCHLPVLCLLIYSLITDEKIYYEALITHAITAMSPVLNPIIYVLRDTTSRRTLKALLRLNRVLAL